VIHTHGSDPLRWYMITNSQPWDNLKFDMGGLDEVKRKFFGTLYNTYSFFALYANVDGFRYAEKEVPVKERPEIDRWIISLLHSLIREVHDAYESYEPTRAGRAISEFVTEHLSNWYVRLNRKRYWGGEYNTDKIAAYQTLYNCLETVSILASPIAPFYCDKMFHDLNRVTGRHQKGSVHLEEFPAYDPQLIDEPLEERMNLAQRISSMVLGLRRKVNIKVRQPLNKIMLPVLNNGFAEKILAVKNLVLTEINVKDVEFISDSSGILVKRIKPNFKSLGPKYSTLMKAISAQIAALSQENIIRLEKEGAYPIQVDGQTIELLPEDVEIISEDIPGWLVANEGSLTVALDINITDELRDEGFARELINRIQNLRKESGYEVTDKISIQIQRHEAFNRAVQKHADYIGSQTLANTIELVDHLNDQNARKVEIDEQIETFIRIERLNEENN
jgi:isoleucyl-tRNA synthetase